MPAFLIGFYGLVKLFPSNGCRPFLYAGGRWLTYCRPLVYCLSTMNDKNILAELKRRVAKAGQAAVARDLGVSRSYICHLLKNRRPPSIAIAESLGFEVVYRRR